MPAPTEKGARHLIRAALVPGDQASAELDSWLALRPGAAVDPQKLGRSETKLLPLVCGNLERNGIQHPFIDACADLRAHARRRNKKLFGFAVEALTALERAGIDAMVLKGIWLASEVYDDPAERRHRIPFGGYHQPSVENNAWDDELIRTARGTPAGEALRRHWHPIALTAELEDVPLPVKLLGEELVLFRDKSARLGLLQRRCSHRGTSLAYGIVSERGLRCCYHGWLYDIDGTILETPADPNAPVRHNVCHGAYPVREHQGLVFAWLGDPDEMPPLPRYDSWLDPADNELVPFRLSYPCNWLQIHENTADPIHIPFLHGRVSGIQFSPGFSELPALSFRETPYGLAVASTRCADGKLWMRSADVMLPNVAQYPPAFETRQQRRAVVGAWVTRWVTPVDETHSLIIGYRHFNSTIDPDGAGRRDAIGVEAIDFAGQVAQEPDVATRRPGDYEAIVGQGPITLHDAEHLVASDRGVSMFRRAWRRQIRAATSGTASGVPDPLPTFTAEVVLPCTVTPTSEALREIGDLSLELLTSDASAPMQARAERLATHIEELIT